MVVKVSGTSGAHFLDAGDTPVVPSLNRYGRSLHDLINMVAELPDPLVAGAPLAASALRGDPEG